MGQTLNIQIHSFHSIRFYLNTNFIIINILPGLVGSLAFPIILQHISYWVGLFWAVLGGRTHKENSLNSVYPVFCCLLSKLYYICIWCCAAAISYVDCMEVGSCFEFILRSHLSVDKYMCRFKVWQGDIYIVLFIFPRN